MNKVLTIIVPAYNMERYLERCLSSLLIEDSLMQEFEVLVINDGSKDRTSEIAHEFESNYPGTFQVIDKENGHYGSCINCGLQEAKGIFVKVLDADDAFNSSAFAFFLVYLKSTDILQNAELILTDYRLVDERGLKIRDIYFTQYSSPFSFENITPADKMEWFIHGITYRTDILRQIHYKQSEGILYTDAEWIILPLQKVHILYRYECLLYNYTVGRKGQSVSKESRVRNGWMQLTVLKKIIQQLNSHVCTSDNQIFFMRSILFREICSIYQIQLLTYHSDFHPYSDLSEFDSFLYSESNDTYNLLEKYSTTIAGIPFTPIADWRKGNVRFSLAQQLYSFAHWMNSIFRAK